MADGVLLWHHGTACRPTLECYVSNSVQRCFPDDDPRARIFTPDIQLSFDDYRKYNFSKDAELLYILELTSQL